MKALAQANAFNINYFDFELINGVNNNLLALQDISVFPNPAREKFQLRFAHGNDRDISIKLVDLTGRFSQILYKGKTEHGFNEFSFSVNPQWAKGIYFIELKDEFNRYFKKIIIE
jgi:hypothetical protein